MLNLHNDYTGCTEFSSSVIHCWTATNYKTVPFSVIGSPQDMHRKMRINNKGSYPLDIIAGFNLQETNIR